MEGNGIYIRLFIIAKTREELSGFSITLHILSQQNEKDTKAVIFYLQNTLSPETDTLTNKAHDLG